MRAMGKRSRIVTREKNGRTGENLSVVKGRPVF